MGTELKHDSKDKESVNDNIKAVKTISLKRSFITVFLCWIIPVLVIVGVLIYYSFFQVKEQINATVKTSIDGLVDANNDKFKSALDASREVSYDTVISSANDEYAADGDAVRLYNSVTSYLSRIYRTNNDIRATFLYYLDRPDTVYHVTNISHPNSYNAAAAYRAGVHTQSLELSEMIGTKMAFVQHNGTIYMVRNIVNKYFEPYAVIVTELDMDNLFRSLDSVVWIENAVIDIEGKKAIIIGDSYIEEDAPSTTERSFVLVDDGFTRSVYKISEKVDGYSVNYILQVNTSEISGTFVGFSITLLVLMLCLIPITFLAVYYAYRNITAPLGSLVKVAEEIEKGQLGSVVESETRIAELQYLVERFNDMSTSMKKQFEQSYLEQLALQDARTKALQSQINPHFLNNTLEIINWEARLSGNVSVSKMIEALSTILGAATARGGKSIVHLSEEMMFVDSYFYIISVRMGKRLEVNREIDESLLDCDVPILVLQPIIENAVEHGIGNKQKGIINVKVYKKNKMLVIDIENNGTLSKEDKAAIDELLRWDGESESDKTNHGQLGIRNVNHRIKLIYGEKYGLVIKSGGEKGDMTVARLTLPIKTKLKKPTVGIIESK